MKGREEEVEEYRYKVHVHKSEEDFISKHEFKTQPSLFKTVQF